MRSTGSRLSPRHLTVARLALASTVVLAATLGLAPLAAARHPHAHGARSLSVRDEGHLRLIRSSGSVLLDEGHAYGTFSGWVRARFTYNGEPDVSAQFTIWGNGGSISARGSGRLSSPTSVTPSFRGHMSITGGTGRYSHIHGGGELFGVFNRRSYDLTVQAIGSLRY